MTATTAEVTAVDRSMPSLVRVTLRSPAFQRASWTPGAKLQVRPVPGKMTMRTFTPTRWDRDAGETELIGFVHGDGPAAAWFAAAEVGATLPAYNPRRSIDLTGAGPALFVGDESSVALARALAHVTSDVRHVFEATDPETLRALVTELGLGPHPTVVPKQESGAALLEATRGAAAQFGEPFVLVASGDAATVHALRRDVRSWPDQPRTVHGKAYWATGRKGLD